jgi:FkbM family methyltransferase
MRIQKTKEQFRNKQISKPEFIDEMYKYHLVLWDYASELKNTEIEKIEILSGDIIFTSRKTDYHPGGLRFGIDIMDKRNVPLETFNFNFYEKDDSQMIFKIVRPDSHIIDIGANIGWYTIHTAAMLKSGNIHCFEPIPETHKKLVNNIKLNNLTNIVVNNIALSEKKQTLTFYFDPYQSGSSSSKDITESPTVERIQLESMTFDEYVEKNKLAKIDFVKCDVEGAELFVFQGAMNTLKKYTPVVFTELLRKWAAKFGYHPNDIMDLFHSIGYGAYYTREGYLHPIDKIDENTVNTNFFFLHKQNHKNIIADLCQKN